MLSTNQNALYTTSYVLKRTATFGHSTAPFSEAHLMKQIFISKETKLISTKIEIKFLEFHSRTKSVTAQFV